MKTLPFIYGALLHVHFSSSICLAVHYDLLSLYVDVAAVVSALVVIIRRHSWDSALSIGARTKSNSIGVRTLRC
jgi:hypothetical protein